MKTYLFVGDTHGDHDFLERAAEMAAEHDAEIIQVGDWGYVWPGLNPRTLQVKTKGVAEAQLKYVSTLLARAGEKYAKPPVRMRFIDGNHDWHPELRRMVMNAHELSDGILPGGGVLLAPNVIYQERGSTYEDEDGTRFLFCGGAPSIDREFRTDGRSWWKEEIISEDEFQCCMDAPGPFHIIVTHDAPDYPMGYGPKGSKLHREQAARSMEMVRLLVHKHEPELLVHGHWHSMYSRKMWNTTVTGLGCNYDKLDNAVMLWSRVP